MSFTYIYTPFSSKHDFVENEEGLLNADIV